MARYVLRVNGHDGEVEAEAGDSRLSVLRYEVGLTGSRFGCGEGGEGPARPGSTAPRPGATRPVIVTK